MSNSLHYFRTKKTPEFHKTVYENKDFLNVTISSEDPKILAVSKYQKLHKAPFNIYVDLECIIEKIDGCKSNPENSSTTKKSKQIPSCFSMSTISSFRGIENKHNVYRSKDCIKKFCDVFRQHAMKMIILKRKRM